MAEDPDSPPNDDPLYRRRFDPSSESASVAVIHAVAAVDDVDPEGIRPTLHQTIDPDSLNRLTEHDGGVTVDFVFDTYRVVVDAGGEIRIYEATV